jgi:hypothetical protein
LSDAKIIVEVSTIFIIALIGQISLIGFDALIGCIYLIVFVVWGA